MAVKEYEKAVKLAPRNATIRNNLAVALYTIMDFSGAKEQIEIAIDIDPQNVIAWAKKGDIETIMNEYREAMNSYKAGLVLDPSDAACQEGLRKCIVQIEEKAAAHAKEQADNRISELRAAALAQAAAQAK
eukprot:3073805-Ditylum_brightwellii.AAC.1